MRLIRESSPDLRADLISLDVFDFSSGKPGSSNQRFNSYAHLFKYDGYFNRAVDLSRNGENRIWDVPAFVLYYGREVDRCRSVLTQLGPEDVVFFFSDKEKPVEILVSLSKELWCSRTVLVDEGIVTYKSSREWFQSILKFFIVKGLGLKYISRSYHYGRSGLYDLSLSSLPEQSVLNGPGNFRLPSFQAGDVAGLVSNDDFVLTGRYVLYVSSALEQAIGYPPEREIAFLQTLIDALDRIGYRVVVKPHPVEPRSKFQALGQATIIREHLLPVEIFFCDDSVILSAISSSLINASRAGVPTASLSTIMGVYGKDVDSLRKFEGITFPQDMKSLIEFVQSSQRRKPQSRQLQPAFLRRLSS